MVDGLTVFGRRVGDQVAVAVAIGLVERAARAILGGGQAGEPEA